jgi:NADPH-dependent ferric siderophore reductase
MTSRTPRPAALTYSLRGFDRMRGTLDIEFVLHGNDGPASRWVARAESGDSVGLAGPGGPRLSRGNADFHLLAGDLTALPAIAAVLENLPTSARGAVLIEVEDAGDELDLRHPPGVTLHWLRAGASSQPPDAVRQIDWPSSARIFATVAGENDAVLAIRRHLRRDRGVPAESLYAVPYWRRLASRSGARRIAAAAGAESAGRVRAHCRRRGHRRRDPTRYVRLAR